MKESQTITITIEQLPFGIELKRIWQGMICRCYSEKNPSFKLYGFRGIKVCDEWKNDFMTFYKWSIENGYFYEPRRTYNNEKRIKNVWSIDRIDVNGNYEPSNCRWADDITQSRNRRNQSEWKKRHNFLLKGSKSISNEPPKIKIDKITICDEKGTHTIQAR